MFTKSLARNMKGARLIPAWRLEGTSTISNAFKVSAETDLKFINCWLRALLALVSQLLIACRAKRLGRCPFFCRLFPRFATL